MDSLKSKWRAIRNSRSKQFRHRPLDLSRNQIRLLRIHSQQTGAPVKCSLTHYDLQEADSKYMALSYVWGPETPTQTIVVNDKLFEVRENLYQYLSRDTGANHFNETLLWVDQICIDQQNNGEKNHQVQQMKDVFSRALGVTIWLGKHEDNSPLAIETIAKWNMWSRLRPNSLALESLHALFNRPYWTRLWVVQEVALAKKIFVACGDGITAWERFVKFEEDRIHHGRGSALHDLFDKHSSVVRLLTSRSSSPPYVKHRSLVDAILEFSGQTCENPRDKIYGILGIVSEAQRRDLSVDYARSITEVFVDAVEIILREELSPGQTTFRPALLEALHYLAFAMSVPVLGANGEGKFPTHDSQVLLPPQNANSGERALPLVREAAISRLTREPFRVVWSGEWTADSRLLFRRAITQRFCTDDLANEVDILRI